MNARPNTMGGASPLDSGICLGYIQGFIRGVEVGEILLKAPKRLICVPDASTAGQVMMVILKFLRDNPARLHENASVLVTHSLQSAFPCRD